MNYHRAFARDKGGKLGRNSEGGGRVRDLQFGGEEGRRGV